MSGRGRIGLTGDVMLGRTVDERQRHRPPEAVWGTALDRLRGLDGLIVNLECCLSTRGERWTRTYRPFHFRGDPGRAIPALDAAGVDCCALANNHVLDFGEVALEDTLDHLDAAGIAHAGAGRDVDAALAPARAAIGGLDVAVVSFTDNTPEYAATEDAPGTAHVEIDVGNDDTRDRVAEALSRAREPAPDLLVASLHWGPNMVEEPPPAFEAFGRWLVDRGVDLVHGHSAHVFHGVEVYDGAPILYDAGDFVDDYAVDPDLRNDRSFLFEVRTDADAAIEEVRLLPTEIRDCRVHEARGDAARWCRERMRERSEPFGTEFERDGEGLVVAV
ncbi:CapA family protein [Halomarina halobia]|uniref:CapA family protein n=1 Tax=Halomarina halobia TaxID=3033386 RepID=A0ABD6A5M9_9EURY|nr:CapA family protein [Halomarina sp. PSR21]